MGLPGNGFAALAILSFFNACNAPSKTGTDETTRTDQEKRMAFHQEPEFLKAYSNEPLCEGLALSSCDIILRTKRGEKFDPVATHDRCRAENLKGFSNKKECLSTRCETGDISSCERAREYNGNLRQANQRGPLQISSVIPQEYRGEWVKNQQICGTDVRKGDGRLIVTSDGLMLSGNRYKVESVSIVSKGLTVVYSQNKSADMLPVKQLRLSDKKNRIYTNMAGKGQGLVKCQSADVSS